MARNPQRKRYCVSCRSRRHPSGLLRFHVDASGTLTLDTHQHGSGRGVWLCPSRNCLERAQKRTRGLERALRRRHLHLPSLIAMAREDTQRQIHRSFIESFRSGLLLGGRTRLLQAERDDSMRALLLASDAGTRLKSSLKLNYPFLPTWQFDTSSAALGKLIGRGPRAAFVLHSGAPATMLIDSLQRGRHLG